MEIEIRKPVNHTELWVNGCKVGEHLCGSKQTWKEKYKTKENWAKKQVKKRLEVAQNNLDRLENEMNYWEVIIDRLSNNQ